MTQPNFCSACGAPLKATDKFCSNCGAEIGNAENCRQWNNTPPPSHQNTTGVFPRMLAYIPGLFWVPLAADSKDKNNRECANQGLLLLLYCIMFPILFSVAGIILASIGLTSATNTSTVVTPAVPYIYTYSYPNASNVIIGLLIALISTLFTLYVPVNSIWGFIHCINHCEPHILPVIRKIKIIKS